MLCSVNSKLKSLWEMSCKALKVSRESGLHNSHLWNSRGEGALGTGGSLTEKLPMAVVEGCSEGRVKVGVLSAAVTVAAVNPQFCGEGRTEPLVPGSAVL